MPPTKTTSVRLAAAQPMLREGLRLLIEAELDLRVDEAEEADVTVLDFADAGALEHLRQSAEKSNGRYIVLADSCDFDQLEEVLRAGVRGIVVKSAHPASLLQAIRSVSQGLKWLDPEIQEKLSSPDAILPSSRERWESLSKRERQIAILVLEGLRYKDIAGNLHISDHTVRNHLRNIFAKLQITSRVELAPYVNETVAR